VAVRIAVVAGTRPEAIKLAPVVGLLGSEALVIHTGQHYSPGMSGHLATEIAFEPNNLPDETRGGQLGRLTGALDRTFRLHQPDAVLVQGDTTSALAGALAANTAGVPLAHLEAGLRSFDRAMPEEHNRVLIDHLSDLCCAPGPVAFANLLAERVAPERIEITGNTIVEAVAAALPSELEQQAFLDHLQLVRSGYVLATVHRPENTDDTESLRTILSELAALPLPVVLPVHPRTQRHIDAFGLTHLAGKLKLIAPTAYPALLTLINNAAVIVSDSGGIQEEVTVLKRPVLVVRRSNERPEAERLFGKRVSPGGEICRIASAWIQDAAAIRARLASIPTPTGTDPLRLA
jgi:UDP-N-acetylglucosamine 2-epimerase (non-hydrolysing)